MALKDITLGQYFPGKTIIHRLDPRTKLIGTIACNSSAETEGKTSGTNRPPSFAMPCAIA